jgi:hypothetical protein
MSSLGPDQHALLSTEYARKGYVVLLRLIDPRIAAEWEVKHRSLPVKRAYVGTDHQARWVEQGFRDPSLALDGLAFSDGLINLVSGIAGLGAIDRRRTLIWINRYGPGDRVPTHCDGEGGTQLLLCLQGLPEPEKGGELVLRDEVIPLRTGDAVLFFARGIPHGVQPVGSPEVGPSGFSRVTCAIRLFAANDPEGATS